jgi:uncharacterized membrane protein YebE (DUF533 family)
LLCFYFEVQVDSLNVEQLIGSVIQGALGGKRKRSRGVARFLTGGKSSFLNASTLLALGGLAWGVYETMTQSTGTEGSPPGPSPAPPRPVASGLVVPPPLPTSGAVVPPPLPGSASTPGIRPELLRVLRLTLSAARADGVLSASERDAILAQARSVGAEAIVTPELDAPRPLAEIASGVTDARVREDLYTLAFSIIRADEQVLDDERRYLDELARHLGLDAAAVTRLEQQAADRIAQASRD